MDFSWDLNQGEIFSTRRRGRVVSKERPSQEGRVFNARYWTRTSDLTGVIRAL